MFKSRKHILGFDDRIMMLIGIPLVGIMINAILFSHLLQEEQYSEFSMCHIAALIYTALYWLVFREVHIYFVKKYPGYHNMKTRYLRMFPLMLVAFLILKIFTAVTLDKYIHSRFGGAEPEPVVEFVSTLVFLGLIVTLYEVKYLSFQLRNSMLEKEQLVKENISSQLEGLRNQVNPHFLFNSLNTLSSIIPEDPEKAVSFISKLSKVYRYILEIKDKKIIPLKEELEFLESYTFLLKERFGDNIDIQVIIPAEKMDQYIVPLSLQITFENAIKHNIISKDKPLLIEVFIENDEKLIVKNNLQKKNVTGSSTKVGLQNIKNRYSFFTDQTVDVIATVHHFIVSLPLLQNQT